MIYTNKGHVRNWETAKLEEALTRYEGEPTEHVYCSAIRSELAARKPKPLFPVGSQVCHRSFVDCFQKHHDAVTGLTVIESRLIEPGSIPAYYRIKAVGANGFGYVEAAERFFDADGGNIPPAVPLSPDVVPALSEYQTETKQLADEFSRQLRKELNADTIAEVVKRNAQYAADGLADVCASHEFCDANMSMLAAWETVFGVDPFDADGGMLSDSTIDRMNKAWDMAKANGFEVSTNG